MKVLSKVNRKKNVQVLKKAKNIKKFKHTYIKGKWEIFTIKLDVIKLKWELLMMEIISPKKKIFKLFWKNYQISLKYKLIETSLSKLYNANISLINIYFLLILFPSFKLKSIYYFKPLKWTT